MKVFISWSDNRSRKIADLLSDWLPTIIQAIEPWLSTNIPKGARSMTEISSELEKTQVGIICLTSENLDNNWILFEAGALSKMKDTKVCTFLLDLTPSDIKPPLSQFQHTTFTKTEIYKLLETINQQLPAAGEKSIAEKTLRQVFDRSWSEFEEKVKEILKSHPAKTKHVRPDREILEEILTLVRKESTKASSIENGLTEEDFELVKRIGGKYKRLRDEFGVKPSEAVKTIFSELDQQNILISPFLRKSIYDYLNTQ